MWPLTFGKSLNSFSCLIGSFLILFSTISFLILKDRLKVSVMKNCKNKSGSLYNKYLYFVLMAELLVHNQYQTHSHYLDH